MVLDLLSTDMYVSYNLKLAHRIGLHAAIYLGELLNINKKAVQKEKLNEKGMFKLDRMYIEQRTTFSKQEQKELDSALEELLIVNIDSSNKDFLSINVDAITGILLDDNSKLVDKVIQPVKKKRLTKKEAITAQLKENIVTQNEELRAAYEEWIDAVIARQGWMSSASVKEGQTLIDNYTQRDLDVALAIIHIAAINGLRDLSWAINNYEKEYKNKRYSNPNASAQVIAAPTSSNIPLSDEVF